MCVKFETVMWSPVKLSDHLLLYFRQASITEFQLSNFNFFVIERKHIGTNKTMAHIYEPLLNFRNC